MLRPDFQCGQMCFSVPFGREKRSSLVPFEQSISQVVLNAQVFDICIFFKCSNNNELHFISVPS